MKCWSCQADFAGGPFCPSCGKIAARAGGATHFDAFGLPPRYDVDLRALETQFRELSKRLHPDRFAQADPRERRLSLEQSTALNDAYKVLKDPARRAFYLLKLAGVDLGREDAGTQKDIPPHDDLRGASPPQQLLEEVLELREELALARQRKDLAKAKAMAEEVKPKRAAALAAAAAALRTLESTGASTSAAESKGASARTAEERAAVTRASHELARVRYFTRFLEEVDAILEEALA